MSINRCLEFFFSKLAHLGLTGTTTGSHSFIWGLMDLSGTQNISKGSLGLKYGSNILSWCQKSSIMITGITGTKTVLQRSTRTQKWFGKAGLGSNEFLGAH